MSAFTLFELVSAVRQLAEERPDFIYAAQSGFSGAIGCSYVAASIRQDEGEGCIVGQALQRLGVSEEVLREIEHERGEPIGIPDLLSDHGVEIGYLPPYSGPEAHVQVNWLSTVQSMQDQGHSWRTSMERADANSMAVGV